MFGRIAEILEAQTNTLRQRPSTGPMQRDVEQALRLLSEVTAALAARESGLADKSVWVRCTVAGDDDSLAAATLITIRLVRQAAANPAVSPERAEPLPAIDVGPRLALKLKEAEYNKVPLSALVDELARLSGVPMTIDVEALIDAGVAVDVPVTIRRSGTTVGALLRDVLAEHGLVSVTDPGGLLITTATRQHDAFRTEHYDVSDLAGTPAAAEQLAALCRRLVAPSTWKDRGGRGKITAADGKLSVEQDGEAHDDLAAFLDKLRVARGRPPRHLPGIRLETRFARAQERLLGEVTANFQQPTPLTKIVEYLEQRSKLTILIDTVALRKAGVAATAEATLKVDKEPLLAALDKLAEQLDLGLRIVDERTVQITHRLAAARGELEFYSLAELLDKDGTKDGTVDQLLAQLTSRVASDTWVTAGGRGDLHFDPTSRYLIVTQASAVQIRIENYLATERAKRQAPAEKEPLPK